MEKMEFKNGKCPAAMESRLADMLFDPDAAPVKLREHVEQCAPCRAELAELKATMALLDTWQGPEPSPYFMTRLDARMRDERQAAPAGWFARLRARIAYGPSMHVRPLAAMALTIMLLVGGGAYLNITVWDQPAVQPSQTAAVVGDLQILENNAQLLDQMEAMSNSNTNGD
jgi:hypothetical protein